MIWRDIRPGAVVYHTLMTHWGKGIVQKVVNATLLERRFERGSRRRILVQFEGLHNPARMQLRELRKMPNKKKIREMVEFYAHQGQVVEDGGDRLILPSKETTSTRGAK